MEFTRVRMSNSLSVALAMALVFLQPFSSSFGEENPQKNNNKLSVNDEKCDMYQGSWIFDDSYPLYNSSTCPFIRKEFDCLKYGRLDHSYLKYRWQPRNCDLPRFDGQKMLESLKGKKIMFVGDSISLNQWESLLCLINSALPQTNFTTQNNSSVSSVVFEDYEVSFFLMTSHYLVDIEEETQGRVLKLDSLKNGDSWKEMDVLVFNSWLWWFRRDQWDYIQYGDTIVKNMDLMEAYRMGLTTWANWVDSSVDQEKTKVFFQGISPSHYNGTDWNKPNVTNCGEENEPISGSIYSTGLPRASYVVEDVLGRIKNPVHLLNITTLSQLRKDGHPSRYNAFKGMDCTHWCIAGVQDTWNQILYALLTS